MPCRAVLGHGGRRVWVLPPSPGFFRSLAGLGVSPAKAYPALLEARAAARRAATFDMLVAALEYLRLAAGKPTLKELAEVARQNGEWLLPSTASDMLRRKTRRPRREIVLAFARACGEPDEWLPEWEGGWSRASRAPRCQAGYSGPCGEG